MSDHEQDPLDDIEPEPRRGHTAVIAGVVAVVALVVAVAAWFLQFGGPTPPPRVAEAPAPVTPAPSASTPGGAVKPLDTTPLPPRMVDSSATTYPLSNWQIAPVPARGGAIERARILGRADATQQGNLRQDDLLEITGWAGDPALGMRVGKVLLSACDQIFASAAVGRPRPDIAKSVHRNLTESGWVAEILLGHVPRCDNTVIRAWGVAPGRPLLLEMEAELPLPAEPRPVAPLPAVTLRAPLAGPPAEPISPSTFLVLERAAPLRSCGAADCATVATLAQGRNDGYLIERSGEWVLIAVGGNAGWIIDSAIEILPLQKDGTPPPSPPANGQSKNPARDRR
ncbi:hypothetical protein [Desertibaculum subflavum]|uniref:hypothetical protein n=1 Tax=Desertibaculum subflavum TaxID=2268458 RepID=UPI000E670758